MNKVFLHYWGKADKKYEKEPKWHILAYHSLDVAAVASVWWDSNPSIQRTFLASFNSPESLKAQLRAWVMFFVALHDLGKFDIRFQLKAPEALAAAWRTLKKEEHGLSVSEIKGFDHGWAGMAWAKGEYRKWVNLDDSNNEIWERWNPWLSAVTGHHGDFPENSMDKLILDTDEEIIAHDNLARKDFVITLESLFLKSAGLSLKNSPPFCSVSAKHLVAGFCSVCDWLGSNTDVFQYQHLALDIAAYFKQRRQKIQEENILKNFGLLRTPATYKGVKELLKSNEMPRGVQVEVDNLPITTGLTLVEAPTGSGKTEAALAYAWRLLNHGLADSIVFALPTQATANAMLERLEELAKTMFGTANVVLAHGKRNFSSEFQNLIARGQHVSAQGREEASVQCASWLANSRKRVFLGQIGVCTVDQVLLSVLPVRHKFVRGFGLNKSVLIVDEVHAYDAYMHGLLGEVLRRQKETEGIAILLSATLPEGVRKKLFEEWEASGIENPPYPAIWHASQDVADCRTVPANQLSKRYEVGIDCVKLPDAFPNEAIIQKIIEAAKEGAWVAVILNLVDDAQKLARLLRDNTKIAVDVFHARYRFIDRQEKESAVNENYGRNATRTSGRILVATQVVEQSLDLDFDWMLTQICPVDLLFQRLGRLHRHERTRPRGFESSRCTVISVDGEDYGLHKLIYGNTRVLWRTEQLISGTDHIVFPEAYRVWIEKVYQRDDWEAEPEAVFLDYDKFSALQNMRETDAKQLTTMTVTAFRDEDSRVTGLTRDSEMNLTVLPCLNGGQFLTGEEMQLFKDGERQEQLNLQSIPVPGSWKKMLSDCRIENEGDLAGFWQLEMEVDQKGDWRSINGNFHYSTDFGLEKEKA